VGGPWKVVLGDRYGLSLFGDLRNPVITTAIATPGLKRLARRPYKAMIYPNRDRTTGRLTPNSYLIGWEYSTNDDFQDIVCQVDNVVLLDK
jgi:hypothetical protein